jgi:membrane-associated phospholipid phosphatase
MAAPFSLAADPFIRKDWKKLTLLYAESLFITNGLTTLTKQLVQRKRPYTYNDSAPSHIKMEKDATASFFSGHTSLSATSAFYTAKVYADYHPDSPAKPYVWIAAAVLPAATGYFRYEAGEHFPTDVVVGYFVGASVGILIPEIHKVKDNE